MIRTENLGVRYGDADVLQNVTLSFKQQSVTAIVGPSGCGKSSFLAALNRMTELIPGAQVTGNVFLDGRNCRDIDAVSLRRDVGMIFQRPNPFPMSIRANIELGLKEHGIGDGSSLADVTTKVLQDVGLWDEVRHRLETSALQLSGGQQQRLCIARALALQPKVILFDEPCSALDPAASSVVESHISRLRESYTVVIVTHNLAQARRLADNTAVFWANEGVGEVIEYGSTADVFSNPQNKTAAAWLSGALG